MRKKKVNDDDKIINFYELKGVQKFIKKSHNPYFESHNIQVPFRSVIIGSSGSGKTNCLLNIIEKMRETFNHIYIYSKMEEPLYEYLQSVISNDLLTVKHSLKDLNDFDEKNYYGQSLVILDDLCAEKDQSSIIDLFIRGRKIAGGISLIYLTQSYYKVPKIIRLQCQYIIIIKTSGKKDLKLILSEYNLNGEVDQLLNMYNNVCVSSDFGNFLLMDLNAIQNKTYRKNFKTYLNINDY